MCFHLPSSHGGLCPMRSTNEQVCFFILCSSGIDTRGTAVLSKPSTGDKHVIVALTAVLLYSVFAYFALRIRDISRTNRLATFNISYTSYLKWVCKIVLEWAKAVVVVLCLKEQGMEFEPKLTYSVITFVYYLCTEKIFLEIIPALIELFNIERLDSLEYLYVPLLMNIYTILAGIIIEIYSLTMNYSLFAAFSVYFLVYLRIKDAYFNQYRSLLAEKEAFRSFRVATKDDIQEWADICAVCLSTMSRARITPCNHMFHPYCLKQCLKSSFNCPLCKQHFLDSDPRPK